MPANRPTHVMIGGLLLGSFAAIAFAPWRHGHSEKEDVRTADQEKLTEDQIQSLHKHLDSNEDGMVQKSEMMEHAKRSLHKHEAVTVSKPEAMKDAGKDDSAQSDVGSVQEKSDTNRDDKLDSEKVLADPEKQASGADKEEIKKGPALKTLETERFKAADKNGDGVLSRDELPALSSPKVDAAERMKQSDHDGNGKLNPSEFREISDGGKNADNKDKGKISLSDEAQADFARLDVNHDGRLNSSEFQRWESRDGFPALSSSEIDAAETINHFDRDADKMLNLMEFQTISDFSRLDVNHDGLLDSSEFLRCLCGGAERFKQFDRDGDGKLNPMELWEKSDGFKNSLTADEGEMYLFDAAQADFDRLDVNHDGQLDSFEFQPWESGQFENELAIEHMFEVADMDFDNQLTLDEMLGAPWQMSFCDVQFRFDDWSGGPNC